MGTLSTCKLYRYKQTMYAFFPQFLDHEHFYLSLDDQMTVDFVQTALAYLRANWEMNGRPTFTLPVTRFLLGEQGKKSPVINLLKKLRAGYSAGVRTKVGKLADFLKTSHITKLSFMHGYPVVDDCALSPVGMKRAMTLESSNSLLSLYDNSPANPSPRLRRRGPSPNRDHERIQRRSMVIGSVRRSRRAASRFFDDELDGAGSPKSIMNLLASQSHGGKRRSLHLKHSASPAEFHSRSLSTGSYGGVQMDDLLEQLAVADSLQDQADILYCIYLQKGLHFDCKLNEEEGCTVGVLYEEIYERAAHQQLWSLVRHAAGVVGKEVEELAAAATDILVHQKQFTVGLPPATVEITVTRPLPPEELKSIIYGTYGEDVSTAVLTQEILLYLAMFMRTTPSMFLEMLTLRIGLIIHVMTAELGRSLTCKGDEAAEQLMNLRPSQMKKLLYHIINGEEFTETIESTGEEDGRFRRRLVTIHALKRRDTAGIVKLKQHAREELSGKPRGANDSGSDDESPMTSLHGQWIRRRRLDGALNRVPIGFYSNVWRILQRCSGLKLDKHILYSHPTIEEMTEGELKFALTVESWLNRLPQPEYRQLMVEALMVLGMLVDTDPGQSLGDIVSIGSLVYDANKLFLESAFAGINNPPLAVHQDDTIVEDFYDCAPSGRFGTMSFLTQAVVNRVQALPRIAPLPDCRVS
ncbi:phosphorylase b kinase regulatory subunit alpha, liver isoform-like [Corticium candelabrum]|uniref:phosphorylase b kinase regulatory subunit alpha, liver isoform-like n=1 Tax=Corticium candelabrum TaxID=121492 RepID=UPI002E264463|nr:phosphorylase b kinase regulatory subunit alpha, liver isoform-like [Corticium candelabrum]